MMGFFGSTNSPLRYLSHSPSFGSSLQRFTTEILFTPCGFASKSVYPTAKKPTLGSKYLDCIGVLGRITKELFSSMVILPPAAPPPPKPPVAGAGVLAYVFTVLISTLMGYDFTLV